VGEHWGDRGAAQNVIFDFGLISGFIGLFPFYVVKMTISLGCCKELSTLSTSWLTSSGSTTHLLKKGSSEGGAYALATKGKVNGRKHGIRRR